MTGDPTDLLRIDALCVLPTAFGAGFLEGSRLPFGVTAEAATAASDSPVCGYRCKVKDTTGKQYALLPLFSNIFAVPAWCIRTSEDEEEANMDVQHKKVSVTAASESNNVEVPVLVNKCALKK